MKATAGLDLCDDVSQISVSTKEFDGSTGVMTLPVTVGSEKYCVHTCAMKRKNKNEWIFGEDAIREDPKEGYLFGDLLSLALKEKTLLIEEEEYDTVSILAGFVKSMLKKVTFVSEWPQKAELFITVRDLTAAMVDILRRMVEQMELRGVEVRFLSHAESFFYYSASQPEELRLHKVCLLDYSGNVVRSSILSTNRQMKPNVTMIEEREFELPEKKDDELLDICREIMDSQIISSVYLSGQGFEGNWEKETIRYLCLKRRRVFQGMNLYTKGACYAALDATGQSRLSENEVFLDKDKLKSNIGMDLVSDGQVHYHSLVDAGINWFDAGAELDVMLGHENEIRILLTPITGNEERCVVLRMDSIPERPDRASRVHLSIRLKSPDEMCVKIRDLGFGEIFPATGNEIEETVILSDQTQILTV